MQELWFLSARNVEDKPVQLDRESGEGLIKIKTTALGFSTSKNV